MKVRRLLYSGRWLSGLAVLIGLCLSLPAEAITQGYPTSGPIAPGSLVALAADGSGKVVPADQTLAARLLGVVVAQGSTPISLGAPSGQVEVATDGTVTTFVSTAGGDIAAGDLITVSPIAAVGMKAVSGGRVLGVAQDSFSARTPGVQLVTVGAGAPARQVAVGQIGVRIAVSTTSGQAGTLIAPSLIQNLANALAGRSVAPVRLYVALLILVVALICVTVLLYAAVRNSLLAIGRNPLARSSITRSLLMVIAAVVAILLVAAAAIWLVIR